MNVDTFLPIFLVVFSLVLLAFHWVGWSGLAKAGMKPSLRWMAFSLSVSSATVMVTCLAEIPFTRDHVSSLLHQVEWVNMASWTVFVLAFLFHVKNTRGVRAELKELEERDRELTRRLDEMRGRS